MPFCQFEAVLSPIRTKVPPPAHPHAQAQDLEEEDLRAVGVGGVRRLTIGPEIDLAKRGLITRAEVLNRRKRNPFEEGLVSTARGVKKQGRAAAAATATALAPWRLVPRETAATTLETEGSCLNF